MSQILRKMLLGYMQAAPEAAPGSAPAAEAPPATPGTPEDPAEEVVNWESLSDQQPGEDDGEETGTPGATPGDQPPAPVAPASPSTPAAPAAPATPPSPAPVPPVAAPAVVPGTPPAPAPTPAPATPAPAQPTQEQLAEQAKVFREHAITNLTKQYESELSDEDKQQLLTDPEKVIPRLLAKATFDGIQIAQQLTHQSIMRDLPAVQHHQSAVRAAEESFFKAHPDLAKPEYNKVLVRMAQTARELNPNGTQEQVSAAAASLARTSLGLPTPGAPAATPAPAVPARPFSPASGSGASPGRTSSVNKANEWAELAKDEDY
jgi:hypothetical protein